MIPNSKDTLARYCLQALGAPVLDIALDEDQISDRIDDAIQFYTEFNSDGLERGYYIHRVRGNSMVIGNTAPFADGELITGSTSGATTKFFYAENATNLWVDNPTGTFLVGETITGSISGASDVIASYTTGDLQNGYVTVPDHIVAVLQMFPFDASTSTNSVFDIRYQLRLSDLYSLQSAQLIQYEQIQYHLALIENIFVGDKPIRFNKNTNKIYCDIDWRNEVLIGEYIIFEVYGALDPEEFTKIYNDRSLKKLATAYLKKQWGVNLSMYDKIALPGGVFLNGSQILQDGIRESQEAEDMIRDSYEEPCSFFIG